MDFFEKSKSEKLLFCIKVWKNAKKNLGPIGPFWNMRNWQIKKTYLHYMSIFQSCRILVIYSLNERIRGVQEENIIMLGFSSRILVEKLPNMSKMFNFCQICAFLTYLAIFLPKFSKKTPTWLYFLLVLLECFHLSYRTLKSDNFEKLTYNANMFF